MIKIIILRLVLVITIIESTTGTVSVACSGGGIRAQVGCLTALHQFEQIYTIDDLYGISGGSWGVATWKMMHGKGDVLVPLFNQCKEKGQYGEFDFHATGEVNYHEKWKENIKKQILAPFGRVPTFSSLNHNKPIVHIVTDIFGTTNSFGKTGHEKTCDATDDKLTCYDWMDLSEEVFDLKNAYYVRTSIDMPSIIQSVWSIYGPYNIIGRYKDLWDNKNKPLKLLQAYGKGIAESYVHSGKQILNSHQNLENSGKHNLGLLEWLTSSSSAFIEAPLKIQPQTYNVMGRDLQFTDTGGFCNIPILNPFMQNKANILAFDFSGYNGVLDKREESLEVATLTLFKCLTYYKLVLKIDIKINGQNFNVFDMIKGGDPTEIMNNIKPKPIGDDFALMEIVMSKGNKKSNIYYVSFMGGYNGIKLGEEFDTFNLNHKSSAKHFKCDELEHLVTELDKQYGGIVKEIMKIKNQFIKIDKNLQN